MLDVREAGVGDARLITSLTRAAFSFPYQKPCRVQPPLALKDRPETIRAEFRMGVRMWIVWDGALPVGVVRAKQDADENIHLFRLGTVPSHRNRGVGRQLIECVEAYARGAGIMRVTLNCLVERGLLPYYFHVGYVVSVLVPLNRQPYTVARMEKWVA